MSKKINFEYIILTIIILVGFVIRLYKINNPIADWHSWRQADTASVSRIYVEKGINLLYPKYHDISSIQSGIFDPEGFRFVEFPIYNAIHVLLFEAAPSIGLEIWGRLLTIASAIVTAVFLYLIGKRFLGAWGGLLSSFFYLFIPYNIYFTRVILPDPFGTMLGVSSLWFFIRYIDDSKEFNIYLSAILMALAFLIKPFFGFYLTPVAYLAINRFGFKNLLKTGGRVRSFLIYGLIIFAPLLLWRYWEGLHPEGIPFFKWAFNGDGIRFRPAFWHWIFEERLGQLILGGWGLILFVFGIMSAKAKNYFVNYFLLGILLYVVVVATANVRHDYYQIITIPAISLSLAAGTVYLWEGHFFNKIFSRILVIFCVYMMLTTGWSLIKDDYNINHPEIIAAGREVDRITPKDALVVAPYNGDTAFLYQTQRSGWPAIDDSIDNIIAKGASYYVSVDLGSADTKMIESRFTTVEKTEKYIIINLREPLNPK